MEKNENVVILSVNTTNRDELLEVVTDKPVFKHLTKEGEEYTNEKFALSFNEFKKVVAKAGVRARLYGADIQQKHFAKAAAFATAVCAEAVITVESNIVEAGDIIPSTDGLKAENSMWVHRITSFEKTFSKEDTEMLAEAKAMYVQGVEMAKSIVFKPMF